mmetsp:Transcript_99716/g.197757  ORF Transcript_99716/g.197757 Transcript_99716/m.197757 type:complete len:139 (-) Transcript_99716:23-439(-)
MTNGKQSTYLQHPLMVLPRQMMVGGVANGSLTTHGMMASADVKPGILEKAVGMDGGAMAIAQEVTHRTMSILLHAMKPSACHSHGCKIARNASVHGSAGTSWSLALQQKTNAEDTHVCSAVKMVRNIVTMLLLKIGDQ